MTRPGDRSRRQTVTGGQLEPLRTAAGNSGRQMAAPAMAAMAAIAATNSGRQMAGAIDEQLPISERGQ